MSRANPLWGAPHIHGELLKLGFEIAQSTVARYMCRSRLPPSQGWRTFLSNHAEGIAEIDLFVLPTIAFRILYCLVIIRHGRRIWLSFSVTENPTAEWISRQITEAFPWDQGAAISHSGSGHFVWASLHAASARHGYSRPADFIPITLAKRLR